MSRRTRVLAPSTIASAPTPGQSGRLVYAGGDDVQAGQIVAIGGPATPYGFLGQATRVSHQGAQTVVLTRPTTLLKAVPQGSLDAGFATAVARSSGVRRPFRDA